MEKRIGAAILLIESKEHVDILNQVLSMHSSIIIARQGIPLHDRGISIISLILEGTTDQLSSLTGKLGRIEGVQVKSVLTRTE
jgi:putative iron-only hydrogenase system regulator